MQSTRNENGSKPVRIRKRITRSYSSSLPRLEWSFWIERDRLLLHLRWHGRIQERYGHAKEIGVDQRRYQAKMGRLLGPFKQFSQAGDDITPSRIQSPQRNRPECRQADPHLTLPEFSILVQVRSGSGLLPCLYSR